MTGQLSGVVQKLGYRVLGSAFPKVNHYRRFSACTVCTIGKVTLWEGSETGEGIAQTENGTWDWSKAQYAIH